MLGKKRAAVVWQLPRNFQRNLPRLENFARAFGCGARRAMRSSFAARRGSTMKLLPACSRYQIDVCQSDAPGWPLWDAVTTDLVYVRLHGHTALYESRYTERELQWWARRVRRWLRERRDVHVYFDNTAKGHAPRNALRLLELID